MEHLNAILRILERETGLSFLWKKAGAVSSCSCGFDASHTLHCNPFCAKIKKFRLPCCVENDVRILPDRAARTGRPFLSTCHAGVSEIVIPLRIYGGYAEMVMGGVFRLPGASCPYAFCRKMFEALPERTETSCRFFMELADPLSAVIRAYHAEQDACRNRQSVRDARIADAMTRIRRDFAKNLTLETMSKQAGLSPSRFSHLFHAETGKTMSDFLKDARLTEAEGLLRMTTLTLTEVMARSGFHDQSRFSMFFRERTGYTPGVYRRKFGKKMNV